MKLASLGSGSKGNATLVECADTRVLLDCGFTATEAARRLERLGFHPRQLNAIIVTHEHGDHIRGVAALARRFQLPVFMTFGTRRALEESHTVTRGIDFYEVRADRPFTVGALEVEPVPVPHDAREPCQYVFRGGKRVAGVLTDLGSLTPHVVGCYSECDALVLECNHDPGLLAAGPYPPVLKRRVGGRLGHLSNMQAAALLEQVNQDRLQSLVLSHLSEKNNTPDHALREVRQVVEQGRERIQVASQGAGFDWVEIS